MKANPMKKALVLLDRGIKLIASATKELAKIKLDTPVKVKKSLKTKRKPRKSKPQESN